MTTIQTTRGGFCFLIRRRLLLPALLLGVSLLDFSQRLRSRRGANVRLFLALLRQNFQRRADVRSLTRVLVDLSLLLLHNRRLVFFVLFSIRRRPRDSCRLFSLPEQRLDLRVEEQKRSGVSEVRSHALFCS